MPRHALNQPMKQPIANAEVRMIMVIIGFPHFVLRRGRRRMLQGVGCDVIPTDSRRGVEACFLIFLFFRIVLLPFLQSEHMSQYDYSMTHIS